MSAYAAFPPAVRAIIDRKAEAFAEARGITLDEARELIARATVTTAHRPTRGH